MVYLVFFCISVFFAYRANRAGKRSTFIFLSLLSILTTVLLAGLRDVSIGIDTKNYYEDYWLWAMRSASLRDFLGAYFSKSGGRFEVLFILLARLTAKATGSFQVYLFAIHLIIITCVYIGAFRLKKYAEPAVTLLLFYLLYYNHSLNISRQYIAMALIFAAVADLEKRKFLRYLVCVAVAVMFHTSGILGIVHLMLYLIMFPQKRLAKVPYSRRLLLCVLIVAFTVSFVPLAELLVRSGVLGSHFRHYLMHDKASVPGSVTIMLIAEFLLLILCWQKVRTSDRYAIFFLFCSVAFLALYQISPYIFYGKRVAAYFSFANIVTLGAIIRSFRRQKNKLIVSAAIFGMVFIYWFYFYYYLNGSETMPYIIGV